MWSAEGRDPHPLFSTSWYLAQNPEVAGLNPLEHYVRWGCHHGRSPHPFFDCEWYLEQYPDVASAGLDPLQHYLKFGARAGRDPSPLFDSSWYLEQNPDLGSDVNPLRHYLECGALEGRDPHPLSTPAGICDRIRRLRPGRLTRSSTTFFRALTKADRPIRFSIAHGISNNTRMSQDSTRSHIT